MKKFFLLAALLGMTGFMNAQTYKSFKASTEEVVVDQTAGATTAEFTVTLDGEAAKVISTPTVQVWNGTAYVQSDLTVTTVDATTGTYSVTLPTNGLAKTEGSTKYVIEFAEGSFTNNDASIESNKLSLRLVVVPTPSFTTGRPTFYLETGIDEGDLRVEVTASGSNESGDYENNTIVSINETAKALLPTGVTATIEDGKGIITLTPEWYTTLSAAHNSNYYALAGLFETNFSKSTNGWANRYRLDIHDRVDFQPTVTGSYDNKATSLTFTLTPNPRQTGVYDQYEHGATTIDRNNDVHVSYITLGDADPEDEANRYPVVSRTGSTWTVDLGSNDALNAYIASGAKITVYGDFYAENTHATKSLESANFTVTQYEEDGLEVKDVLIRAADNTDKLDLDYVEITFPDGISLNAEALVVPANTINLAYGSDVHYVKSIKPVEEGSNNYIVEFENPLTLGNQYILNIPAGQLKGLGDDNVMYKNATDVNLAVSVKHVFNFYDNYGTDTPVTTLASEVVADNYDFIQYNRTYTGKMEALYVPFDVDLSTAKVKVGDAYEDIADHFKFYKIYAFTNDPVDPATATKLHVAENTVLHANMPYLVMCISTPGDKTIYMEDAKIAAPANDNNSVEVKSETVYQRYYFYGKTAAASISSYGLSGDVMAVSKSGSIVKAGSSATLKAWRWLLNVKNKSGISDSNYAKVIDIVVDEDEATAIKNVNAANASNGAMYNVAGQQISAPVKGQIYIQNGKKFISK